MALTLEGRAVQVSLKFAPVARYRSGSSSGSVADASQGIEVRLRLLPDGLAAGQRKFFVQRIILALPETGINARDGSVLPFLQAVDFHFEFTRQGVRGSPKRPAIDSVFQIFLS